ncbi:MAG: hypothetical protein WCO35_00630 [Candidatus Nomurabacteria bacterium]
MTNFNVNYPDLKSPEELLGEEIIQKEVNENIKLILADFKSKTNEPGVISSKFKVENLPFKREIVQSKTIHMLIEADWEIEVQDEKGKPVLDKSPSIHFCKSNSWIISVIDRKLIKKLF